MKTLRLLEFLGLALLLIGCAAVPSGEQEADRPTVPLEEQPAAAAAALEPQPGSAEQPAAAEEPSWQYPMAAGMWYPGDGPLPAHPFRYYRVRCWPGCHDPNSAPRPHNY